MTESKKIDWKHTIREMILKEITRRGNAKFASTRAVYYWLGSLGVIPLTEKGYKSLNALSVDMRKQEEIPWGYFPVLRGTNGTTASRWIAPETFFDTYKRILLDCPKYFELPMWLHQPYHVEVWVEKVGMLPDVERAVSGLDIQCRAVEGFPPWEFVFSNLEDIKEYREDREEDSQFVILYLGDLDPSGRDIARQLVDALQFFGLPAKLQWIGILPEHVQKYGLPEIPRDAKVIEKIHRDSRYPRYMEWLHKNGIEGEMFAELDAWNAVAPGAIADELRPAVEQYFDSKIFDLTKKEHTKNIHELNKFVEDARKRLQ